jgi:hypothetical protein
LPTSGIVDIEPFQLFDSRLISPRHSPVDSVATLNHPASCLPNFRTLIDDLHLGSSSTGPAGNTGFECGLVGGNVFMQDCRSV